MSESRLLYEIMQRLGGYGYVVRCNSGSVKLPNGKRFNAMPQGFSGIMAVLPGGRVAFLEVKTDKGRLYPEQVKFLDRMRGLGTIAACVRSVDEALQICGLGGS
jgi:hypothetical protein